MDSSMSIEESGALRKKQVKKSNPELMKNALHYFPNWDAALEQCKV